MNNNLKQNINQSNHHHYQQQQQQQQLQNQKQQNKLLSKNNNNNNNNNDENDPNNFKHLNFFSHNKAGMDGIDENEIKRRNKIIYDASKDSAYFKHKKKS